MGSLSINDCGTAHEAQLLDIYNDLLDSERKKTNKEPTLLEKSNIELQVAEAYQSILKVCKDGGQIAKALELLKERTKNVDVNELSDIANDIANETLEKPIIKENDIKDVVGFETVQTISNGFTEEIVNSQIDSRIKKLNPEEIQGYSKGIGTIVAAYESDEGRTYILTEPEDSKYDFSSEEDKECEVEIQRRYAYIDSLCREAKENPEKAEKNLELISRTLSGLGIDAALRFLNENPSCANGDIFFDKDNSFYREFLIKTLEATRKDPEFSEDNYTTLYQLKIISEIFNNSKIHGENQEVVGELIKTIKESCPELYECFEKDSEFYLKLERQVRSSENINDGDISIGAETIAINVAGNTTPISQDETLRKIENMLLKSPISVENEYIASKEEIDVKKDGEQQTETEKEIEKTVLRQDSSLQDTIERKKKVIISSMRRIGVGPTVSSFFSSGSLDNDRGEIPMIMSELLDFENSNGTSEFIDMITSDDIRIMKERLEKLIETQADRKKDYICVLGNIVSKSIEKDKIFSANKAVPKLIEDMGKENQIFEEHSDFDDAR